MKILVEIDVEEVKENEFEKDVENGIDYVDYNLINQDEYWNNDFYYEFGDDINRKINEELKGRNRIGIIKSWRFYNN